MAKVFNEDDLRSMFIPADELGIDTGKITVDADYWFSEMYEMYKDSCHFEDCLDPSQSNEVHCPLDKLNPHKFTAYGRVGYFRWHALTLYFDESVHKMDDKKSKYNSHHLETACKDIMNDPVDNMLQAINNDEELVSFLEHDPVVVSTEPVLHLQHTEDPGEQYLLNESHEQFWLEARLSNFLNNNSSVAEVFKNTNEQFEVNIDPIKGKDVILAFRWANKWSLDAYGQLARLCALGCANTVFGFFLSRIAPTLDGKESNSAIPKKYQPCSCAPRISLFG